MKLSTPGGRQSRLLTALRRSWKQLILTTWPLDPSILPCIFMWILRCDANLWAQVGTKRNRSNFLLMICIQGLATTIFRSLSMNFRVHVKTSASRCDITISQHHSGFCSNGCVSEAGIQEYGIDIVSTHTHVTNGEELLSACLSQDLLICWTWIVSQPHRPVCFCDQKRMCHTLERAAVQVTLFDHFWSCKDLSGWLDVAINLEAKLLADGHWVHASPSTVVILSAQKSSPKSWVNPGGWLRAVAHFSSKTWNVMGKT